MHIKLLVFFLFVFTSINFAQHNTEKFHRAKVHYKSDAMFHQLESLGLPMDHGKHKKGHFVISDFSESEITTARNLGVEVDILIEDVQQFYVDQNKPQHHRVSDNNVVTNLLCTSTGSPIYTTPANYNNGSMGGFLTYTEMLQELDDMNSLYPNLISARGAISTYTTAEGRTLQYVKISDNPTTDESGTEPQVLYTAIHHAREPASLQQLIFYMWYLLENYATNDEIKAIVDNTELYFVPCMNPDGYVYNETTNPNGGGLWRKNRRNNGGSYGVDNNRNYSYITPGGTEVWNTAGTSGPTGSTYAGPSVFSEPENQAIRWLVEQNNFIVSLNAHSYGNLLLFPYGYANNAPTPENATFQAISEAMVAENNYTNQIAAALYPAAGDSDDFMYGVLNTTSGGTRNKIYAMTPEIGNSFWPAANQIEDIAKGMIYLNTTAAQMANNFATIEDTSPLFVPTTFTTVNYNIQRLGLQAPANFTVSINPISANIQSVGNPNNHNGLTLMQNQNDSISLNLTPGIMTGDDIIYELIINNGLYDKKITVTRKFGSTTTVLDEPADDTTTYWDNTNWGVTTSEFYSANSSITDSPNGNYASNENKTIVLNNQIDLTTATNATLSFYAKWDIENDYDYVQVEIATNGVNWVPQCGKFTNMGVSDQTGAVNEPLYDGSQNSWVFEEIDLSDYLGQNILIRFLLVSDGGLERDGFYFDDLKVNIVDAALGTSEYITNNFELYPNPVHDKLYINTNLTNYSYRLYTIQGQLLLEQKNKSNLSVIDYAQLASGMYLIDIEQEGKRKTFKIVKN